MPRRDPMRIGIDARKLHDFGIGTYLRNLVTELARLDDDAEYVAALPRRRRRLARRRSARDVRPVVDARRQLLVREQFDVPLAAVARAASTLFHSPHYVLPPLVPCPSVVTIHDCIHLMFPQYLPNRLAYRLRPRVHVVGDAAGARRS